MVTKELSASPEDETRDEVALVARTAVPDGKPYLSYKYILRYDFFHCCAYCTISESEAQGFRFTIDHYEPQNSRPDLKDTYSNLMWSCDTCNQRKSDRTPPQAARDAGVRFFRPDHDRYSDHFERSGLRLNPLSKAADFTIDALDLNRSALRRLRKIRTTLYECESAITAGFMGLRTYKLDRLPARLRFRAMKAIKQLQVEHENVVRIIDAVLRENAASPLLDPDADALERSEARKRKLAKTEAIYPGDWRAPRKNSRKFTGPT